MLVLISPLFESENPCDYMTIQKALFPQLTAMHEGDLYYWKARMKLPHESMSLQNSSLLFSIPASELSYCSISIATSL